MNKLWILRPCGYDKCNSCNEEAVPANWDPWYDKAFGFIICAPDETAARLIASGKAGDESKYAWLDSGQSTCVELAAGDIGIVMMDFHAA